MQVYRSISEAFSSVNIWTKLPAVKGVLLVGRIKRVSGIRF